MSVNQAPFQIKGADVDRELIEVLQELAGDLNGEESAVGQGAKTQIVGSA